MRSLSMLLLMCGLLACTDNTPGGGDRDLATARDLAGGGGADGPGPGDGGGGADDLGNACSGLKSCDCRANAACQPISEPCYCPHPECGPGACICGGGAFLGCAPVASACESTVTCRPAGRVVGDAKGCLDCKYASDCGTAFKQMMDKLKATPGCGISDALVSAFSCSQKPDCMTKCVNAVAKCEDIGCGLCAACGCAKIGTFERCVQACFN